MGSLYQGAQIETLTVIMARSTCLAAFSRISVRLAVAESGVDRPVHLPPFLNVMVNVLPVM